MSSQAARHEQVARDGAEEATAGPRVLFVSDVYFPRVNGVSSSIRTFRDDLAALGVHSELVAPDYATAGAAADAGSAAVEEAGTWRVRSVAVRGDPEDRCMRWGSLQRTLARLGAQRFDVVHVQTPFLAHYAGVRFARAHGLPVIATYHTLFEEYLHHYVKPLPRPIGRALARSFTRRQCGQLSAVVAPSAPLRERLLEYGVSTPVEVIPTGLPVERYRAGDGARFRAQIGIGARQPLLLYVGRVAYEKNIDFLLRVFARLQRTRPAARFVIAGEGPARPHLRSLAAHLGIESQVLFVGYLERTRALADCYAAADVFVFASRTETQGLVLLEALAQGRPVVSTAYLGTAAVLHEGCGARIVAEDEQAFVAAIGALLDDPAQAAALSAQARAYAESWASACMARRLVDLYRGLVAKTERTVGAS